MSSAIDPQSRDPAKPFNDRYEKFIELLIEGDRSLTAAWVMSGGMKAEDATPGHRVSASRAGKKVEARVAYLRALRAATPRPDASEPMTADRLQTMMQSVTATLIAASDAAKACGEHIVANSIQAEIVTHSGRLQRLQNRTGPAPKAKVKALPIDRDRVVAAFYDCTCDD